MSPHWWSGSTPPFSRASEEPYRRRTSDGVRVVIAVIGVVWLSQDTTKNSNLALAVFHALNGLPSSFRPAANLFYRAAALWVGALVVAAAVASRRWRLALTLLLAGAASWLFARGLGFVLADGFTPGIKAVVRSGSSNGFPNVAMSLVVGVVCAAGPYLTRRVRWFGDFLVLLLVPTELYLGVALPRSLACAAILGWGTAAAVHLIFGSPAGRPTTVQVQEALHDLGVIAATDVRLAPVQPGEHTEMLAQDGSANLIVKVLGRDEREARLLGKVWKFFYYKDSGPTLYLTRIQEVEHQAYLTLLAATGGVRVPPIVAAGTGGPGTVLLAERDLGGSPVSEIDPAQLAPGGGRDGLLADIWAQAGRLHELRVSHGRLNTSRVRATPEGAAITGFGWATAAASADQLSGDVAELLATTSAQFGAEAAVGEAVRALGPETVAAALPVLQPSALSRGARQIIGGSHREQGKLLAALRQAAAEGAGVEVPQLEQVHRISGTNLALAIGSLVAIAALLSFVSNPQELWDTIKSANPWLLLLAFCLDLSTALGFAIALAGSVRKRLPAWPALKLQTAGNFANLALPFGTQALQIVFLQKYGVDAATAVTAGGVIIVVTGTIGQILGFVLASALAPAPVNVGQIPSGTIETLLAIIVIVILLASVLILAIPKLRHKVLPPVTLGLHAIVDVFRSPRQALFLIGGSMLAYMLYGVALTVTLASLGQHPSVWDVIAANLGVTLVTSLVPIPGATTAVSTVGLSGALVSIGVPETQAVGAVLLHTLLSSYLPAVPGYVAMKSLLKHGDL